MNGISPQEKKDERLCNQGEGYVITLQPRWPFRSKCFPEGRAPQPSCPFSTEQAPEALRRGRTLPELLAELLVLCLDDSELGSGLYVCPYLTAFLTRPQATYGQVGACYVYHHILTVKKALPRADGEPQG